MIQIEELRYGSLVKCKVSNDSAIYQVIAIDGWNEKVMLSGVRKGEWYSLDKIKPIKLTDDWLLKFGFKNIHGRWFLDDFILDYYNKTIKTKVDFVHRLQNLYFEIENKELKLI